MVQRVTRRQGVVVRVQERKKETEHAISTVSRSRSQQWRDRYAAFTDTAVTRVS